MQNSRTSLITLGLTASLLIGCGDDEEAASVGVSATSGATEGETDTAGTESMTSDPSVGSESMSGGTDSTATASAGTDSNSDTTSASATASAGTDSAGTDSDATDSAGTDSAGTDSAGTDSAGTGSTGSGESGQSGDTGNQVICEAPGELMPCDEGTNDPFNAIGLGCPFGENQAIPIMNHVFSSPDAEAWQIGTQFGTYVDPVTMEPIWGPREGSSFLLISSGHIDAPDADGVITMTEGSTQSGTSNGNPDSPLPAPASPLPGSNGGAGGTPFVNCDGVNDCSDSLNEQWALGNQQARDLLWFQFEVVVPGGTFGYSFDFAYFSAEFPEYVDSSFNDIFLAWSSSETYTGNLCFVNDQPCTVTALENEVLYNASTSPELDGTGFDGTDFYPEGIAQATGWFTAQGTASPGETLGLTFAIFDMGDTILDTAVILDNFAWDCEGCVPSEVDPCVGIDPV